MTLLAKQLSDGKCIRPCLEKGMSGKHPVFFSSSRRSMGFLSRGWKLFLLLLLLEILVCLTARGQTLAPDAKAAAGAFGEESPYAEGFYEKALAHHADPQWVKGVMERAKSMRDQGLPTQPFFLKASEGLAKRVAPPKILPALDKTQAQTESAGHLVDQAVSRGAIVRSPEAKRESILHYQRALLNEVPPATLEKLSNRIDPTSRSKIRIDQLGEAARDFPKLKKKGLSDDQALETFERRTKEEKAPQKKLEDFQKMGPDNQFRDQWPGNKPFHEKGGKEHREKKEKEFDKREKNWDRPDKNKGEARKDEKSERNSYPKKGPPSPEFPHGNNQGPPHDNSHGRENEHGHGHGKGD